MAILKNISIQNLLQQNEEMAEYYRATNNRFQYKICYSKIDAGVKFYPRYLFQYKICYSKICRF